MIDGKFVQKTTLNSNITVNELEADLGGRIRRYLRRENPISRNLERDNGNNKVYRARRCPCMPASISNHSYCLASNNANLCEISDGQSGAICYYSTPYSHIVRNSWSLVVLWYAAMIIYLASTQAGRSTVRYVCSKLFCKGDEYRINLAQIIIERENLESLERIRRVEAQRLMRTRNSVTYLLKTKYYCSPDSYATCASNEVPKLSLTSSTLSSTPNSSFVGSTFSDGYDDDDDGDGDIDNAGEDNPLDSFKTSKLRTGSSIPISRSPTTTSKLTTTRITDTVCLSSAKSIQGIQTYKNDAKAPLIAPDYDDPYVSDSEDGNETCTICILPIQNGDRIGALECDHKFHVKCLKEWIKRRNVCPLCQSPNIAGVRQTPDSNENIQLSGNLGGGDNEMITTRMVDRPQINNTTATGSMLARMRGRDARSEVVNYQHSNGNMGRLFPGNTLFGSNNSRGLGRGRGRGRRRRVPNIEPSNSTSVSLSTTDDVGARSSDTTIDNS